MIKPRLILLLVILFPLQRNPAQVKINIQSPENIKAFADYLFCEKDYLRAYDEYIKYLNQIYDDSVEFKSGLALQRIGSFNEALKLFNHIPMNSEFYTDSHLEYFRTMFLKKDFTGLQVYNLREDSASQDYSFLLRIRNISLLLSREKISEENDFISPFPQSEKKFVKKFYKWKINPPYKSPLLAGIMSSIIPGLGKVYTKNFTDGLFAALLTGLSGYIAYTDFKAGHNFRGWIFTGATAFFYTGNVYGSIASAQIYNAKIKFDFETDVNNFLDVFNYLAGEYNFCK